MSLLHVLFVAVGSAIGGVARFGMVELVSHFTGRTFPWGTMIVNLSGSLFLGWISTLLYEIWTFDENAAVGAREYYMLLCVGVAGGYTTFSSFEMETYRLLREGLWIQPIFYVTTSVVVGLVAFRVGMLLAGGR